MRSAIPFERPHLHFAEALSSELRFPAQGLLCDKGIGAYGAHMNFVFDKVDQFHDIDVAHGNPLIEPVSGPAVVEMHFSVLREIGAHELTADFIGRDPIERRYNRMVSEFMRGPS